MNTISQKLVLAIILCSTLHSCLNRKYNTTASHTPSIYSIPDQKWIRGFDYDSTYLSVLDLEKLRQEKDTFVRFSISPIIVDSSRKNIGIYKYETYGGPFPPSHNMEYFFLKFEDSITISILDTNRAMQTDIFLEQYSNSFDSTQAKWIKDFYISGQFFRSGSWGN